MALKAAKKANRKSGQTMVEYIVIILLVIVGFVAFYELVLRQQLFMPSYNRIVDVAAMPVP